jgi:Protein of unknown function (DUF4058)
MPSPFPGMDPYLEQFWRDIHARCIIYAADQLQARLPGDLRARVEERVFVELAVWATWSVYPDIRAEDTRWANTLLHQMGRRAEQPGSEAE